MSEQPEHLRILRPKEAAKKCGLPKSSMYALIARGAFPRPLKLGTGRASGFLEHELDAWIAARIAEARGDAA